MKKPVDPEGINKKPWADRKRIVPLRTYSGSIRYQKRPGKGWTIKDFERISRKFGDFGPEENTDLVLSLWRIYRALIEKWVFVVVNWFLDRIDPSSLASTLAEFGQSMFVQAANIIEGLISDPKARQARIENMVRTLARMLGVKL